jgi:hypothetical protein
VLIGIQDTKREDKRVEAPTDSRKGMSFAQRRIQIGQLN